MNGDWKQSVREHRHAWIRFTVYKELIKYPPSLDNDSWKKINENKKKEKRKKEKE